MTTIAGNGVRAYAGDGGPARDASLNMPHELCFDDTGDLYIVERDNHLVRRVDWASGIISTVAGTAEPGFAGDGRPADQAWLCRPHSVAVDGRGGLLICDIGNHRIRRVDLRTGVIDTFAGTGERTRTPEVAVLSGTALNGPRTIVAAPDGGELYLALREGNAIYLIDPERNRIEHLAGSGCQGYSGDGAAARDASLAGPKGLAFDPSGVLYVADTENHAIRAIDLTSGMITTVLGGHASAPEHRLARPHGLCVDHTAALYVSDSEGHRILRLRRRRPH